MNKILTAALTAATLTSAAGHARQFTLSDIQSGVYSAKSVPTYRSMADGKHYTALTDNGRSIVKYRYADGEAVDTLLSLEKVDPEGEMDLQQLKLEGYTLSPDEQRILVWANRENIYRRSFKADYFYYVIGRPKFKRLTEGKVQAAILSPDGRKVAFVRDNNLYLTSVMTATIETTERQITKDGERNKVINGVPDWVYEEEFSMNSAITWSPDSKVLAWLRWDESSVKEYSLPIYMGAVPARTEYELYPGAYSYKYPVAGETNSKVSVWTYEVQTRKTRAVHVPQPADGYVPRIQFTHDPAQLAVITLDRHQSDLRLYLANAYSGEARQILEDRNECYVGEGNLDGIRFHEDGFTMVSERDGFRHLYLYNNNGTLRRQITHGPWDVTDVYGYDAKTGNAYIQCAWLGQGAELPNPLVRGIYRVDAKGVMHPLFNGGKDGKGCRGTHSATFSQGFVYMQHRYSDAQTPARTTLETVSNLKTVKVMEDNAKLDADIEGSYSAREFFQFITPQGVTLNGYIQKPRNFDPAKRYPLVMEQYSGPGSQQVLDVWTMGWDQYLTQEGYVVACVDSRGTGARGAAFERQTYRQLGVMESEDLLSAGRYVAGLSYVDPARLALWGWSYGGYATLMTLCGGNDVYRCGMAVAPVTDWKFYDTVYSERYMRTPQENHGGYEKASVLSRSKNLKGEVLLVYGTADDNVHPQNTLELQAKWVEEDIPFQMMVYTNKDHSIRGGNARTHIYTTLYRFLQKNL